MQQLIKSPQQHLTAAIGALELAQSDVYPESQEVHLKTQVNNALKQLHRCVIALGSTKAKMPLYARIRPESGYARQDNGEPFPVEFQPDNNGYIWLGGPGGQYRHSDLQLLLKEGENYLEIPIFANGDEWGYLDQFANAYEYYAHQGQLYPEHYSENIQPFIARLQKIEKLAQTTYPQALEG